MKFGLFSMVQNYLHAMRLVQREKMAWSGERDAIGKDADAQSRPPLTLERKKMVQVRWLSCELKIGHLGGGAGGLEGGDGGNNPPFHQLRIIPVRNLALPQLIKLQL